MIRRPPRSTLSSSSERQMCIRDSLLSPAWRLHLPAAQRAGVRAAGARAGLLRRPGARAFAAVRPRWPAGGAGDAGSRRRLCSLGTDFLVPTGRAGCGLARLPGVVPAAWAGAAGIPVSYTHLRAHETPEHLVCRLLLEKK